MGIGREFIELTEKLGYAFHDISYLETALTHTSYSFEAKAKGQRATSNEELEFLGDAVLELVVSEELYKRYAKQGEGILTKMRQALVCESTLSRIASGLDLGLYLNIGTGEELSDLRSRSKVLADAMEAVIAAVYIDDREHGSAHFRDVILKLFYSEIENIEKRGFSDYKTMLQQLVEKNSGDELHYEYTEEGPEHRKSFVAHAYINNNPVGTGGGSTKRAAEMQAARAALTLFGIIKE